MEDNNREIITINNRDLLVIDEDADVIYTTNINNNEEVVILKKVEKSDDIYELDEVERIPYLENFIKKYKNLIQ